MSYQVLARKWRPATFEQMVGQSHVLHALTNALTQQRLHHAYLFSGTRGVGKTSLARLFAKGLNCEQGVTATPCGKCSACVEIAEGRFVDLIEVDAASRTKVDDTRELLDNVQYRPSRGRYKVYLIDEVHMLSRSSFNALLKTLEEPPEHVKFLLATTDPQRLPVTVLSRCLQFNLKSLTQDEIVAQLNHILTAEQLSFEPSALTLLAKAANGSMRDALSLTDQAIAFGAGQVKLEQVQTMLGSIDEKHVIALLEALAKADVMDLMQVTAKVLSFGAEPEEVLRSLLELLHQITLTQFAPAAAQMSLYSEQIKVFAQQLSAEQVQLYYQLLLTGRKDLPHAPDPKSGLEMALLRAVTFVPEKPVTRWAVGTKSEISLPEVSETPALTEQATAVKPVAPAEKQDATEYSASPDTATPSVDKKPQAQPVEPAVVDSSELKSEQSSNEAATTEEAVDSLNSEMAMIMSQAQSQGFNQDEASEALEPTVDDKRSDGAEVAEVVETAENVEVSSGATKQLESTPQEVAKTEQESAASENSYADYGDDDLASYADYAGAYDGANTDSYNDQHSHYGFDNGDELSYQLNQESSVQPQESDNKANQQTQSVAVASTPEAADANLASGDDILDAVLAARASLLEGLGEDDPKEESSKKSLEVRKPFTPPARKQPEVNQNLNQDEASSEQSTHASEAQTQGQSYSQEHSQEQNAEIQSELNDRPPWEEPHETDPCTRFDAPTTGKAAKVESQAQEVEVKQSEISEEQTTADSSPVQDAELNLPVLPSGEVSGNEVDLKWYRFMSELEVGGRVRQLAVNSVCHQFEQPLSLLLKPDQKHLAADIAIKQLEEAMSSALGEPCTVNVTVGLDSTRETPLEVRRRFHKEILVQAHHDLMTDDNIRWLTQNMGAQLTDDSLTYAPELLVQKGKLIELIDIANFKRLTES
ncbi:DNA polymerase III subunit gamma/tau [Shewanella schlegeliana]|uniref:DNA-directed DNA polymerase n=1 Tax=Shewanella schlegeliana TaxID=190308 RepID=A0ABS1STI3_9GAMM|nr:DNA polymerase III subunit gamma/tau [Shewanella schlegeliana]MBL4911724.1 DNA polymerase III subunit gamma/tau [Shewanella schlegeliana]MCL1110324.1 DNA polymerase III subunit gamma/tau [Shewanella schlegeliana]GIU31432.1 DNA polymerase III subunit gamma/tau [Shewanella schlegeliana]